MSLPDDVDLLALFVSAFLASTLLPGGSEVVLAGLAAHATSSPGWLLAVASAGNTLGGMSSWLIGRLALKVRGPPARLATALERVRRHGAPVLLLSWVPLIGDPLCVAAGWLRIGWLPALACIALGKTVRYAVILWLI